tara:strand:+ start:30259 stop:30852 length:594 start_codon:yes stop_codon:yes gene_type:complete
MDAIARRALCSYLRIMTKRHLPAIAALLLSACAGGGQDGRGYPSLAKRPIETGPADGAARAPADRAADMLAGEQSPEPALLRQLADLAAQVGNGDALFERAYDETAGRIRVAASAPVSSEQWVAAHVLLGALEQARYQSAMAMASLDTLYAERLNAIALGKATGGIPQIEAQRTAALAIVDAQNDKVDALRAVLKEP